MAQVQNTTGSKKPDFSLWAMLVMGIIVGMLATFIYYTASAVSLSAADKCPKYKPNNPNCSVAPESLN